MDNKILLTIVTFKGGPVGLTTIAAVQRVQKLLKKFTEPFLIQEGFIIRTPRGSYRKSLLHLGRIRNNIRRIILGALPKGRLSDNLLGCVCCSKRNLKEPIFNP
jgi:hypothetical protein